MSPDGLGFCKTPSRSRLVKSRFARRQWGLLYRAARRRAIHTEPFSVKPDSKVASKWRRSRRRGPSCGGGSPRAFTCDLHPVTNARPSSRYVPHPPLSRIPLASATNSRADCSCDGQDSGRVRPAGWVSSRSGHPCSLGLCASGECSAGSAHPANQVSRPRRLSIVRIWHPSSDEARKLAGERLLP